jgi:hypothetical protein
MQRTPQIKFQAYVSRAANMLLPGGYSAAAALRHSGLRLGEGTLHGEGGRLLAVLIWRNDTRKLFSPLHDTSYYLLGGLAFASHTFYHLTFRRFGCFEPRPYQDSLLNWGQER